MGLVQCFVAALMLSVQLALTFPSGEPEKSYIKNGKRCLKCRPGEHQHKSCDKCKPCPADTYTAVWNTDDRCDRCSGDCRPEFNLKVAQNCTRVSDVKCVCETGFTCVDMDTFAANCRYCEKIQETTTAEAAAIIASEDKHMPSSASPRRSSASTEPCRFPKCDLQTAAAGNGTQLKAGQVSDRLAAILCPVVVMGFIGLLVLSLTCRPRDKSSFKRAFALLLCNQGGRNASHRSKESAHQFPRDSFSAKQQPPPALSAGPVHVHNPGTVIFSLLSQFTGQVGPTVECGTSAEAGISEEDEERDCPVFHPTSSPGARLSEEERSGEIDSIFFPAQEQGKDCHVSKEEVQ